MNYKNAFKCDDCPETNSKQGCPAWVEYIEENTDGDSRVTKGCLGQEIVPILIQVIRASNRPAAEISKIHNSLHGSFAQIIAIAQQRKPALQQQDEGFPSEH